MIVLFLLGKKTPASDIELDKGFVRIRCPKCEWQPGRNDRWVCSPGCGHWWNTFATRGLCPGCEKRWRETACLRCNVMSPHDDWYETRGTRT